MSYQYTKFKEIPLALHDHDQAHDPMPIESTLVDSIGGAYDWKGTERRKGRRQVISCTGLFFGETEYLTDENGDFLVDENDDFIVAGDGAEMLLAQVTALKEQIGTVGALWRKRLTDNVLEWKTCRFLAMPWPRKWDDHAIIAKVTCQFETQMEFWHAETATETAASCTDGVQTLSIVHNAGQVVDDATITIARTSGTITAVTIGCGDIGVSLAWAGSLGASESLTIDCGAQTIRKGSADAYSGFSYGVSHTAAGWLPLATGQNPLVITVTGGNATVTVSHYNQYP